MFQSRADGLQELEQRPGALGKLESIQTLVREAARMAAHHVAHVQLRHFVVGHVAHREARRRDAASDERIALRPALREREADEDLRRRARPRSGS